MLLALSLSFSSGHLENFSLGFYVVMVNTLGAEREENTNYKCYNN